MVSIDAVPATCPDIDHFIEHAALAAGKYGVGREAIIRAITFFHHEEGMGIELMSLLTPATLVSFSKDQVTEDVGMAIARLAWEWFKEQEGNKEDADEIVYECTTAAGRPTRKSKA
jgi:hypothetical protein